MSLTVGHVLVIALTTAVGAAMGRLIKSRWPRLRYLNEVARAVLFLLGISASVAVVAWQRPGQGRDGRSLHRCGVRHGGVGAPPG